MKIFFLTAILGSASAISTCSDLITQWEGPASEPTRPWALCGGQFCTSSFSCPQDPSSCHPCASAPSPASAGKGCKAIFPTVTDAWCNANCGTNPPPSFCPAGYCKCKGSGPKPPTPKPSKPTPAPAPAPTPGKCKKYTVVSGDNCYAIAQRFGTTLAHVSIGDGVSCPALIHPGDVVTVCPTKPPTDCTYHEVGRGDTCAGIAAHFGTDLAHVFTADGNTCPWMIYPGQQVMVCYKSQQLLGATSSQSSCASLERAAERIHQPWSLCWKDGRTNFCSGSYSCNLQTDICQACATGETKLTTAKASVQPRICPNASKDACATSPGVAPGPDRKCTALCRARGSQAADEQCWGGQNGQPIMITCVCTDGADLFREVCSSTGRSLRGKVMNLA